MHIDSIPLEDKDSSIYDEKELCHLLFYKKDGIVIELRCLKGGYVIFDGMRQVCVKISKTRNHNKARNALGTEIPKAFLIYRKFSKGSMKLFF